MSNEGIEIEELTRKRTPSELLNWVESKMDQMGSTDEGTTALRLRKGHAKQLAEEVYPLALFGWRKYGNTDQILIHPVISNKNYDAVITDLRSKPPSETYIEITQSHEGENKYLRALVLDQQQFVFDRGPVSKKGTKKTGRQVSIPATADALDKLAEHELDRILDAARRKEAKDYPIKTSLVIFFNDDLIFREAVDDTRLDTFVTDNILMLDLRFSMLYLVGLHNKFREFSLSKKT